MWRSLYLLALRFYAMQFAKVLLMKCLMTLKYSNAPRKLRYNKKNCALASYFSYSTSFDTDADIFNSSQTTQKGASGYRHVKSANFNLT